MTYLSAMAPLTIVVAVVAKDIWKKNAAYTTPFRGSFEVGSTKKSPNAMKGVLYALLPKEKANPKAQYVSPEKFLSQPCPSSGCQIRTAKNNISHVLHHDVHLIFNRNAPRF